MKVYVVMDHRLSTGPINGQVAGVFGTEQAMEYFIEQEAGKSPPGMQYLRKCQLHTSCWTLGERRDGNEGGTESIMERMLV